MQNITIQVSEEGLLMLTINLSQELGESASGKSIMIATTGGNIAVPGFEEIKIGLNVYRPMVAARPARRSRFGGV